LNRWAVLSCFYKFELTPWLHQSCSV
jgi:hypothetical protein